jgi:hypothetical protein
MCDLLAPALLALAVVAMSTLADDTPPFRISTKRSDDRAEVKVENGKVVFSVHSPFGISQAVIEHEGEKWPDAVVLRLHLRGLENFRVSNGPITLHAAVSSQQGKVTVRLWKDGKEDAPLDEKSPLWTDIRIVGGDGKPAKELPLKNGYFEMALPRVFFQGNPKSMSLIWTDFYRN